MVDAAVGEQAARARAFPIGATTTVGALERDPHPVLARLREGEPVSWLPALDAWMVSRRDLVVEVMRDAATFTVEDPRFSTGRVVGVSMLTLDGNEHDRHRAPFSAPFRPGEVRQRFRQLVADEVNRLIDARLHAGTAELRAAFAGPLAAAVILRAVGLHATPPQEGLSWYRGIVDAVTALTAGRPLPRAGQDATEALRAALEPALAADPGSSLLAAAAGEAGSLDRDRVISNAAVLLFGGIETTEGAILNAVRHLLLLAADERGRLAADPDLVAGAIEESMRLEPAAATVDRYATRDVELAGARVRRGEAVMASIAAANRDPSIFSHPDRFDPARANARQHLAFAQGPHVCLGVHLARLEVRAAVCGLLSRLPGLRLDPARPDPEPRGLVFRKPGALWVRWDRLHDGAC